MESSDVRAVLWSWIVLPLTAFDWWLAWSRLPERVTMKVGPGGQPTSWATRERAMGFDVGLLAFVLVLTTAVAFAAVFSKPEKARAVSVGTAACNMFVCAVLNGVLWFVQVP